MTKMKTGKGRNKSPGILYARKPGAKSDGRRNGSMSLTKIRRKRELLVLPSVLVSSTMERVKNQRLEF